jgi:hypothetical protein
MYTPLTAIQGVKCLNNQTKYSILQIYSVTRYKRELDLCLLQNLTR